MVRDIMQLVMDKAAGTPFAHKWCETRHSGKYVRRHKILLLYLYPNVEKIIFYLS